jgi:hypothetical protein
MFGYLRDNSLLDAVEFFFTYRYDVQYTSRIRDEYYHIDGRLNFVCKDTHNSLLQQWRIYCAGRCFGIQFDNSHFRPCIATVWTCGETIVAWRHSHFTFHVINELMKEYQKMGHEDGIVMINYVYLQIESPLAPKLTPDMFSLAPVNIRKTIHILTVIRSYGSTSVPTFSQLPNELMFEIFSFL